MKKIRFLIFINFVICIVLMAIAFYYNAIEAVPLCPLCSVQLLCYYIIAVVSIVRFVYLPKKLGRYAYAIFLIIFSVIGVLFASRELWIEHLSNYQSLPCAPNVIDVLENTGISGFFNSLFSLANNACGLNHWQFLGLGMPNWSLIFFVVLIISAIILLFAAKNEREIDANVPTGSTSG